jgi:hypothetical protein
MALSTGLRVFNLLSLRTTSLFVYKVKGYLICNNKELRRIPQVLYLLLILLSSLGFRLR